MIKKRRFCSICEKDVYQANDLETANKYMKNNQCMLVSKEILSEINNIDNDMFFKIDERLKFSKLFLVFEKYHSTKQPPS